MTAGKDSVAVRIAGHEYKIRSGGDPDALREIAGYVDQAMDRVRTRTGTVDTLDVAVLTCLNLAREILALREARAPAGTASVDQDEMRKLIDRVEATLRIEPSVCLPNEEHAAEDAEGSISEAPAQPANAGISAIEEDTRLAQVELAKTLDLPRFESLRERASGARASLDEEAEAEMSEARVAVGGRDRAS